MMMLVRQFFYYARPPGGYDQIMQERAFSVDLIRPGATGSKPTSRFHELFDRKTRYQTLVLVCCILFGLAMIANMQSAADGGWFWYAVFLGSHKRLYADMHLALQPLFVLESILPCVIG